MGGNEATSRQSAAMKTMFRLLVAAATAECEVCEKVLNKVFDTLPKKRKQPQVESALDEFCKTAAGKEKQMCYFIDTVKRDISKPAAMGVPAIKICKRIAKKDSQVCEFSYPTMTNLKGADLGKMRVKALKKILQERNAECQGCSEKSDYINRIKEVAAAEL